MQRAPSYEDVVAEVLSYDLVNDELTRLMQGDVQFDPNEPVQFEPREIPEGTELYYDLEVVDLNGESDRLVGTTTY